MERAMNVIDKAKARTDQPRSRPLPAAPLSRQPLDRYATNSKSTTSRSISPTLRRCSRAIARRCCSAPPGRSSRNWSAMCWPAARGSRGVRRHARRAAAAKSSGACAEAGHRRGRARAAPVQEVVLTGDDADLTKLPVHLQHGTDGGPYISAGIDYVIDPRNGLTNVGMRRLMLRGRTGDAASISSRRAICARSTRPAPRPASRCR